MGCSLKLSCSLPSFLFTFMEKVFLFSMFTLIYLLKQVWSTCFVPSSAVAAWWPLWSTEQSQVLWSLYCSKGRRTHTQVLVGWVPPLPGETSSGWAVDRAEAWTRQSHTEGKDSKRNFLIGIQKKRGWWLQRPRCSVWPEAYLEFYCLSVVAAHSLGCSIQDSCEH